MHVPFICCYDFVMKRSEYKELSRFIRLPRRIAWNFRIESKVYEYLSFAGLVGGLWSSATRQRHIQFTILIQSESNHCDILHGISLCIWVFHNLCEIEKHFFLTFV